MDICLLNKLMRIQVFCLLWESYYFHIKLWVRAAWRQHPLMLSIIIVIRGCQQRQLLCQAARGDAEGVVWPWQQHTPHPSPRGWAAICLWAQCWMPCPWCENALPLCSSYAVNMLDNMKKKLINFNEISNFCYFACHVTQVLITVIQSEFL